MEKNTILTADILDIIFDNKNKMYGAYELRRGYDKRMFKATLFTILLAIFACLGSVYSGIINKDAKQDIEVSDVVITDIRKEDPLPPPPPPPKKQLPPPEPNQVKFVPPVIVADDKVNDDEKIQEITDDAQISTKTLESNEKGLVVAPPLEEKSSQILETPKEDKEGKIFLTVENEAAFPGGVQAWARYLRKNLNGNIPLQNNAPAGTYRVIVRFVVSKDGSISDVTAETKFGFGMEEEAVKIIKVGPKWTPALQNGRNVNAYRRQPVTFLVDEQ